MTKQEYIDKAFYELKKLNYSNHKAIIETVFNDVYNQMLAEMSYKHDLPHFELYSKPYSVSVALDATSNRYYSTLPVAIVGLARPQGGVIGINSSDGEGTKFYPTTEQRIRMINNLEAGLYGRYYRFYVQGTKVWYSNIDAAIAAAGVRMTLVPQFREFAASDEIILPSASDYNITQLVLDRITNDKVIELEMDKTE